MGRWGFNGGRKGPPPRAGISRYLPKPQGPACLLSSQPSVPAGGARAHSGKTVTAWQKGGSLPTSRPSRPSPGFDGSGRSCNQRFPSAALMTPVGTGVGSLSPSSTLTPDRAAHVPLAC